MNRQRVINIIREPLQMQHEKDLPLIKELIEEFPYFSTPYVLLTRLLSEQKSIYLDKYLKLSASYIGDREVLYNLLHAAPKQENPIITEENKVTEAEFEKPGVTETISESEQSISTEEHIYKDEEIVETEPIIKVEDKQELPEETDIQQTAAIQENAVAEKPIIEEKAEVEEVEVEQNTEAAYIESGKNASKNISEKTEETNPAENIALEEISAPDEIEKITEQAVLEPITLTENSAEQNIAEENTAEETKTEAEIISETESQTKQQALEDSSPNKFHLQLPPLAAYDYFAFQEKKTRKAENTEIPAETEKTDTKTEQELSTKISAETTKTPNLPSNISFGAWLAALAQNKTETVQVQDIKPAPQQAETTAKQPVKLERKAKREDVEDIISKFIQTEPRIKPKPAKFFTPQDVAERSAEQDHTLVTETLANIYLKQGLNDKAVEIFQQLMLKYPQKSNYFAVKIQEINTKAV